MNVVVTGASGLFGTSLIETARSTPDMVIFPVSRTLRSGSPKEWLLIDENFETSCAAVSPDVLVHAAGEASPAACEHNPTAAHANNVTLTKRIVALAQQLCIPCVFLSTDLVFDGCSAAPAGGFKEEDPPCPQSIYAKTKILAEEAALNYSRSAVIRISLLIGEGESAGMGFRGYLQRDWRAGKPTRLFVDEWRTALWAKECAEGVLRACRLKLAGLYHFGGVQRVSRYELGEVLARQEGFATDLIERAQRAEFRGDPPRPADVSLDSMRFRLAVGLARSQQHHPHQKT